MTTALRRFRRHVRTPGELRLLLGIAAFMAAIPWVMRRPLPRALRMVERIGSQLAPRNADPDLVIRYVAALGRWKRWSFQDNCVVRSLCYFAFLKRGPEPVELRMGVERKRSASGGGLPGRRHFWVLRGGLPFNDTLNLDDYQVMLRYPGKNGA